MRVFVTVAECGNIKDAANRLFRTQSAISMTLKQLENHLGAPLFVSDRKHSLTELGSYVAGVAGILLRDHDTAVELIEQHAFGYSGTLRIASVPSVAALLIPEVLARFVSDRPTAEIDLVDTDSADVHRLVAQGQADLGIASMGFADAGLVATPIFEDRMMLVCLAGSALARRTDPVDWSDLQEVPLILNETTRGIQSAEFRAMAARTRLRVRNVTSLLAMVGAGAGVTLLPGLATIGLPPMLVARAVSDQSCRRQVGLFRREGRVQSPLARAFQQHFISALPTVTEQLGIVSVYAEAGTTTHCSRCLSEVQCRCNVD